MTSVNWPAVPGVAGYRVTVLDRETGEKKTIYRGEALQATLPEALAARAAWLSYRVDALAGSGPQYAAHVPYAEIVSGQPAGDAGQALTIACPPAPGITAFRLVVRANATDKPLIDRTLGHGPFVLDLGVLAPGTQMRYRLLGFRAGEWIVLERSSLQVPPRAGAQAEPPPQRSRPSAAGRSDGPPLPDESDAGAWWGRCTRYPVEWRGARVLDFGGASTAFAELLLEQAAAGEVHVALPAGSAPAAPTDPARLRRCAGDVLESAEFRDAVYDVVCSSGALAFLAPDHFERTLSWFWDRLRAGGVALLRTRTVFYDDAGGRPYLRAPEAATVLPYCAATYLMYYRAAGFEILQADRVPGETSKNGPAAASPYDPVEHGTRELIALLRRPAAPLDIEMLRGRML
jgi:hypothetical protein